VAASKERFGTPGEAVDVMDTATLARLLSDHELVISAIPYRFGTHVAKAAIDTETHYLDFGGNPTVVAGQKSLDDAAKGARLMVVPDCGLAPGLANVMATKLIDDAEPGPIDSVQMRVGALPQEPVGALGYQLAFNPAGLINEYAEPCEVIEDGGYATVEPLTRFEGVDWDRWGPLEAFSTAGGTSTMSAIHLGRVRNLEYKTLRYPGHGFTFRSLLEIGLFSEQAGTSGESPRDVLLRALETSLPRGEPDLVLVRTWIDQDGHRRTLQIEDVERDGFTALARTTAYPATALAHLIVAGKVLRPGVRSMNEAVLGSELLPELDSVHITVVES
jgi:lysine 6-dehydrogenase